MMHMHAVYTAKDNTHTIGVDTATVHMVPLLGDAVHANLPPKWLEINPDGNVSPTIN